MSVGRTRLISRGDFFCRVSCVLQRSDSSPPMFRPRLPFGLSSRCRTYATRRPEKPPARCPDPLKSNSNAVVTALQDDSNLTFIYRPPPSVPSPHSTTLDPASPLLKSPTRSINGSGGPLPPLLRPSSYKPEPERVSQEVIEKIRGLRLSDPRTYSRTKLAKMFNCTPNFISKVAALRRPQRKQFMGKLEAEHAAVRERWGERRATVVAIRQKRREFW
ncbi:mitochondrial ribosomal protein subunit L20-domain-containing protein [Pisolithus sp. B1]|nr:mitochondrial ribosomal protein subunit L20-domain-containing protein [Pisolithus sp. B1]